MFSCSQSILIIGVDCDVAVGEVAISGNVGELEVGVVDSNLPFIIWPCIIFRMYRWLFRMRI